MTQPRRDRADGFTGRMGLSNLKKIQHCKHPWFVQPWLLNATRPTNPLISAGILRAPHPAPVQAFSAPLPRSQRIGYPSTSRRLGTSSTT
jgi:hypothetical protein